MADDWMETKEEIEFAQRRSGMLAKMRDTELAEIEDEAKLARERLRSVENDIFRKALEVVDGAISFVELDPENPLAIPQEWIDELGDDKAARKHNAATAALRSAKEAPMGLKIAENMASNIIRARASEKQAQVNIGIEKVLIMEAPMKEFPEVVVEAHGEQEEDEY